jgi:PPM family protein phosphatase
VVVLVHPGGWGRVGVRRSGMVGPGRCGRVGSSSEEAESHPQKMILVRALHADSAALPQVRGHDAQLGDRYLLCSDGLHAPVAPSEIQRVLLERVEPEAAVAELAELVHRAGAPDNVVFVVADVLAA